MVNRCVWCSRWLLLLLLLLYDEVVRREKERKSLSLSCWSSMRLQVLSFISVGGTPGADLEHDVAHSPQILLLVGKIVRSDTKGRQGCCTEIPSFGLA